MSKILYLRAANPPRTDLALIEEQLEAIRDRLASYQHGPNWRARHSGSSSALRGW